MATTNKKFDCVEMKNAAQQKLRQEYEKRKNEFFSYVAFVNAATDENSEIREFHNKLAKSKAC
jgi:hypothetical protein